MEDEGQNRYQEIRSDGVEDILGSVPSWITRNGMILFAALILLMIAGSWIFRFPKVRRAEITVTSIQPPAEIRAKTDGKIEELLVHDNEMVNSGQVLAVIENPADYADVVALEKKLESFDIHGKIPLNVDLPVNGHADLGPVQPDYAAFQKSYRDYLEFKRLDYHTRKIELLEKEVERYIDYAGTLKSRSDVLEEDYLLSEKQFLRDSTLFQEKVLAESEYEASRSDMLYKREAWQEVKTIAAENEIRVAVVQAQILDMELKREEQETELVNRLGEALNRLKSSLAQWTNDYLVVSPVDGAVTFNAVWSENQNVRRGEQVMTVIPEKAGNLLGKIKLPVTGAGEVRNGQQVNIRFSNYPYLEYGMVRGVVDHISKVPQDEYYTVEVSLPDGLTTYYGITIDFHQNMQGQAEILTDKLRLIQRIFNPIRNAISRQKSMRETADLSPVH